LSERGKSTLQLVKEYLGGVLLIVLAVISYRFLKEGAVYFTKLHQQNRWMPILLKESLFFFQIMLIFLVWFAWSAIQGQLAKSVRGVPCQKESWRVVVRQLALCVLCGSPIIVCIALFWWKHVHDKYLWMSFDEICLYMTVYTLFYGLTFAFIIWCLLRWSRLSDVRVGRHE